jgi:hypothetical protein
MYDFVAHTLMAAGVPAQVAWQWAWLIVIAMLTKVTA